MSTWGLNTNREVVLRMLSPIHVLQTGKPVQIHDHSYTIDDIRLFNDHIYIAATEEEFGQERVIRTKQGVKEDLPGSVIVIRPDDRRRTNTLLERLRLE